MSCYECKGEGKSYTVDMLVCDDCMPSQEEITRQNKLMSELIFGVKL